jgi:hypothetical protein
MEGPVHPPAPPSSGFDGRSVTESGFSGPVTPLPTSSGRATGAAPHVVFLMSRLRVMSLAAAASARDPVLSAGGREQQGEGSKASGF